MKVRMVNMNVCVLSHLKEELALGTDKWFWIISTIILLKNSHSTKELKGAKNKAI